MAYDQRVVKALREGLAFLEAHEWIRHELVQCDYQERYDEDGLFIEEVEVVSGVCALGALGKGEDPTEGEMAPFFLVPIEYLERAIPVDPTDDGRITYDVASYNDDFADGKSDIIALFVRAISLAESEMGEDEGND